MRATALILLLLALAGVVYWFSDGQHVYDVDQVQVVQVKKDPIFGTETKTTAWKDEFHPGIVWKMGVPVGVLAVAAAGLFFVDLRRRRRIATV